jgi:hypothetical protein
VPSRLLGEEHYLTYSFSRFLFYPTLIYAYIDKQRGDTAVDEEVAEGGGEGAGERTLLLHE